MSLSRRSFLQLSAAALGGLAYTPLLNLQMPEGHCQPIGLGRVTVAVVYVYSQPTFKSVCVGERYRDEVIWLLDEVDSLSSTGRNRRWFRIEGGYTHTAFIQPVQKRDNPLPQDLPPGEFLGEITHPYAQSYRYTPAEGWQKLYRLYYGSVHTINALEEGPDGTPHYRIIDHSLEAEYHAPAAAVRPIPYEDYSPILSALSSLAAPEEKRIQVSIADQMLRAFEGEQLVFESKVSTGLSTRQSGDNALSSETLSSETPIGSFRVRNKMPSCHMGNKQLTSAIDAYELPGVPWTMFFQELGVALHGAYWHNNFGVRMSHGCVNLPNEAARWLFRWSDPVFDPANWYTMGEGTRIAIA